jgi:type IV secretory pathway TrbD component
MPMAERALSREGEADVHRSQSRLSWTEHAIHGSLVRQPLYLGVERTVLAVEGVVCLAVLFGVGLSFVTVALIALVVAVIHPVMVWITARDPQATEIAVRSHAYADFYAPHAALRMSGQDRISRPRPSISRAR